MRPIIIAPLVLCIALVAVLIQQTGNHQKQTKSQTKQNMRMYFLNLSMSCHVCDSMLFQ